MASDEPTIQSGWLRKTCRFNLIHHLKLRYFVLLDTELRYYKHPDDPHPAGIIELKNFNGIQEHNTSNYYGMRLISDMKGEWKPMLYAESKEEQQTWIRRIKTNLDRLSASQRFYSSDFGSSKSLDNSSLVDDDRSLEYHSVLDKWLDKLDLLDGSDNESEYLKKGSGRRASSGLSSQRSRQNSLGSSIKHSKQHDSYIMGDYGNSIYSEPSSMLQGVSYSVSSSSTSISSRQITPPASVKYPVKRPMKRHSSASSASKSTIQYNAPPVNMKMMVALENDKRKYSENTLQYYQHPHMHRSLDNDESDPDFTNSLSPPPPRR